MMSSEKGIRKDKNQNIQVFVRLRPLNQREKDIKSLGVIEVANGREVFVRPSQNSLHTKKFTFDRAFPPHSKQVEVYQEVVSPLIEEVLAGYNCTVFAYGQTGTGKTHTMVGEAAPDETTWQSDPLAGIIPRALSQLFDELRISNTEYTVRVSYLELYNEELFDLLSSSDDNSKLRIYEDVTRKGSNIVNGLEEITVYNKNEVYRIMAQGQERKRVASTLMNAQSSRSHTVFTIVVHMKENSPEGEELVKIGKLNLVDLAGSENISKAGSDNPAKRERARECVNINQSLLTLGRVITALVERHPHIPYRESKLTRILQESLGGRTKTSIIATISPGHKDLEETMSTLEYANRAKNIQNKPEINQKMTKKAILKEYAEEIDKLKRDLQAARDKNGVYLANETFSEMTFKQEEQRKEIQELLLKKRAMEEERDRMESIFRELSEKLQGTEKKLDTTLSKLSSTKNQLANTTNLLSRARVQCSEQRALVAALERTERCLAAQAADLLRAADAASADADKLHAAVDKRKAVECANLEITRTYRSVSAAHRDRVAAAAAAARAALAAAAADLRAHAESYTMENATICNGNKEKIDELVQWEHTNINTVSQIQSQLCEEVESATGRERAALGARVRGAAGEAAGALAAAGERVRERLRRLRDHDLPALLGHVLARRNKLTMEKIESLQNTQDTFKTSVRTAAEARGQNARRGKNARINRASQRMNKLNSWLEAANQDKQQLETELSDLMKETEEEKSDAESRLHLWAEEERRRIESHIASEKKIIEQRYEKNLEKIETKKRVLENKIMEMEERFKQLITDTEEEVEIAGEDLKESELEVERFLGDLEAYTEKYNAACGEVVSSVQELSGETLEVAARGHQELVAALQHAADHVQSTGASLTQKLQELAMQQEQQTGAVFESLSEHFRGAIDTFVQQYTSGGRRAVEELGAVSAAAAQLSELAARHHAAVARAAAALPHAADQLCSAVQAELDKHAELEGRCLNQEYLVYTPSGQTPVRAQYRYPRALAATSPYHRILERHRRQHEDDECVVVSVDSEAGSDTSSGSEEFAVPSAPSPRRSPPPPLLKCTSETDLYLRKRQQESCKENNINRSISLKKPSKLPAPFSHKKPLVERNADN